MSSLPVAARSGSALPRVPLGFMALMLILAVGIGLAVGANVVATSSRATVQAPAVTTPKHHSATPPRAAAAVRMADYRQLVSNLAAANARHDFAAKYRFGRQLDAMLTPVMIGTVYQERAQLLANLEAAAERHDTHSRALISRQLRAICGAPEVQSRLDFCN